MKRLFCLILTLALLLAGCGKQNTEAPTEPSVPETTTVPTTTATVATEATTEATEPTTEATEPPTEPLGTVNPLTGEPLDAPYTGRPVSFTLNNIINCLPQYGLHNLDWMFEVETEGGITRCLGIMTDPASADVVGPIRSARSYFLNLSVSYDAPLFHCGASKYANKRQYSFSEKVSSWDHADQMGDGYSYFYRDSYRYDTLGYDWEHTLFSTGENMARGMEELGFNTSGEEAVDYGYRFSQDIALDGQAADTVTIVFRGEKTTTMEYDAQSGQYLAHQYGTDWVDGSSGENAAFRNVLVISAEQTKSTTGSHSFYELSGSGDGYFAVGGKMIPIQWHHDGVEGPFRFTLEDGTTPITLGVGKTYCAIIDTTGAVIAE